MNFYNIISLVGILVYIFIAWVLSENRKAINKKTVVSGLVIQFLIAIFIFLFPPGTKLFLFFNDVFLKVLNASTAGAEFLFGRLALSPGSTNVYGENSLGFIFAFQVFPIIIFFSALMSILYFYNIMPLLIRYLSKVFTKLMSISGAESLVATSNIFVGIESALTVRPFLDKMTRSELFTILTVSMATVSSSVLGLYVFNLRDVFPTIAAHLMSASLLSAPAAIVISKIMVPESSKPETLGITVSPYYEKESNLIEAIIKGSQEGVKLVVGIAILLVAFLGLVELVNIFLKYFGAQVNVLFDLNCDWSLSYILGYLFYPFTILLGIPFDDTNQVSNILGQRLILTEVVSYQDLSELIKNGVITSKRSIVVSTYALCGFAHIASMAIFVGGISALCPDRRSDLASIGIKALIGATITCMITGCIAGLFFIK